MTERLEDTLDYNRTLCVHTTNMQALTRTINTSDLSWKKLIRSIWATVSMLSGCQDNSRTRTAKFAVCWYSAVEQSAICSLRDTSLSLNIIWTRLNDGWQLIFFDSDKQRTATLWPVLPFRRRLKTSWRTYVRSRRTYARLSYTVVGGYGISHNGDRGGTGAGDARTLRGEARIFRFGIELSWVSKVDI